MSEIFHLVYFSKAAEDLSYTDIREILEVSRRNNAQLGITGMLIFRDGLFLQILEGSEEAVRKVLAAIRDDDRNYSVRVLIEAGGQERLFADWAMAFHDGDITTESSASLDDLFKAVTSGVLSQRTSIVPILKKFRASAPELK